MKISRRTPSISDLPCDVAGLVAAYLDLDGLARARRVSRAGAELPCVLPRMAGILRIARTYFLRRGTAITGPTILLFMLRVAGDRHPTTVAAYFRLMKHIREALLLGY